MGRPGSFPRPSPRHQEYARVKGTRLIERFSGGSSLQARADEVARPYKEGPKALWQVHTTVVLTFHPKRDIWSLPQGIAYGRNGNIYTFQRTGHSSALTLMPED